MANPAAGLHSLTHVRYTPHASWTDRADLPSAYDVFDRLPRDSKHVHMILDSARYVPALSEVVWKTSIYDVKTVLIKTEKDDARPILFRRQPDTSRIISIMGGKIDNIYDLFDLVRMTEPARAEADERHVYPTASTDA